MDLTFYNYTGRPVAYTDDGEHIYLFSGEPVAYIHGDSVYSYSGMHLGWFAHGWIIDHDGDAVFFSEGAVGGPLKPIRQLKPLKSLRQLRPLKGPRGLKPLKPSPRVSWSEWSEEDFFFA